MDKFFKNILVFGIGGTGGYFGGKICDSLKNNDFSKITFIARGEHLDKIKTSGLQLITEEDNIFCKPHFAKNNLDDVDKIFDLILLCVKEYDLHDCLKMIKKHIGTDTIILPVLNGIDIYERIRNVIKNGLVLPATVYVGTHIESPGVVKQKGGEGIIHFGPDKSGKKSGITILKNFFDYCSIKYHYHENPNKAIWEKYIFISTFGLITASKDKTLGQVMENESLFNKTTELMKEIVTIAERDNIKFDSECINNLLNKAKLFPYETKTSFQRDIENKNKKDERDLFCRTLIRKAEMHKLKIPQISQCCNEIERRKTKWQ